MTFEEAFQHTGRKINISISPSEVHQSSRLLNAVTSPNVCIREAVMASCAVPGVFPAVTLMAKNTRGDRLPYVASRKWVDGSIDDLPAKRLARLYGVNHFITSQTNPVVLWALRDSAADDNLASKLIDVYQTATKEWLKATYPFAMALVKHVSAERLRAHGIQPDGTTPPTSTIRSGGCGIRRSCCRCSLPMKRGG
jgi:NTE family protein